MSTMVSGPTRGKVEAASLLPLLKENHSWQEIGLNTLGRTASRHEKVLRFCGFIVQRSRILDIATHKSQNSVTVEIN